jgi:hypothetical protein
MSRHARTIVASCIFASVGLHATVATWLAWRSPSEARVTRPLDTVFPVEPFDDEEAPPLGVPGGTGRGKAPVRTVARTGGAARERHPVASGPAAVAGEASDEHTRALRQSVERAMLAPSDAASDAPGPGSPDGTEGGRGKAKSGGFGYLSGWFSSLISVRQLRLTADETSRATALATVTIADGKVQSATLSGPGPVPAYNQAVAASLASLVGRAVPVDSSGDAPSGTFTLRLNPR